MFVLTSMLNHTPLKYRCPMKISRRIRSPYLRPKVDPKMTQKCDTKRFELADSWVSQLNPLVNTDEVAKLMKLRYVVSNLVFVFGGVFGSLGFTRSIAPKV